MASARFGADSGNDMRQAMARGRAMCSAWANAFRSWATAIEPCNSQMISTATGKSIGCPTGEQQRAPAAPSPRRRARSVDQEPSAVRLGQVGCQPIHRIASHGAVDHRSQHAAAARRRYRQIGIGGDDLARPRVDELGVALQAEGGADQDLLDG